MISWCLITLLKCWVTMKCHHNHNQPYSCSIIIIIFMINITVTIIIIIIITNLFSSPIYFLHKFIFITSAMVNIWWKQKEICKVSWFHHSGKKSLQKRPVVNHQGVCNMNHRNQGALLWVSRGFGIHQVSGVDHVIFQQRPCDLSTKASWNMKAKNWWHEIFQC